MRLAAERGEIEDESTADEHTAATSLRDVLTDRRVVQIDLCAERGGPHAAFARFQAHLERPDFVISLHEGPQAATFVFANRHVTRALADRALDAMARGGTELATHDYFGLKPKATLVVKRVEAFRERSAGKAVRVRDLRHG